MESDEKWEVVKLERAVGRIVSCRVREHKPFGVFVTIDHVPFDGLIPITEFNDETPSPPIKYPPVGAVLDAVVLGFTEPRRKQVWLGVKPSQLAVGRRLH